MYLTSFAEIIARIPEGLPNRVAVVAAEDREAVVATLKAHADGIAEPIFVGNRDAIEILLRAAGVKPDNFLIEEASGPEEAALKGVRLVNEGRAQFLMKGKLETGQLLRAVVAKEGGLGRGGIMSHMAIQTVPAYHKLLVTTDGGMVLYPTLEQKRAIIGNAVGALRSLGYTCPKVAVLAAVEKVNPKMPETLDGAALKEMNERGEISGCMVEGPISFDLAVRPGRAEAKGYVSEVAGDADILVTPNITAGNILGKSLIEMAGATMAGVILGAKVPIVVTSRGSSEEEKYLSLALAAAIALGKDN